jgi:hypothetical protein
MLDDIVFKSQKKSPGLRHFISTPPLACSLARSLTPEPKIKSTHAPSLKEIHQQKQQEQQERRRLLLSYCLSISLCTFRDLPHVLLRSHQNTAFYVPGGSCTHGFSLSRKALVPNSGRYALESLYKLL